MRQKTLGPSDDHIGRDVERLLEAERAGQASLEEARRETEAIVAAARRRADDIRKRADMRISRLHVAMKHRTDAEIARRRAEFLGADDMTVVDPHLEIRPDELARAVDRLAGVLTGEGDER